MKYSWEILLGNHRKCDCPRVWIEKHLRYLWSTLFSISEDASKEDWLSGHGTPWMWVTPIFQTKWNERDEPLTPVFLEFSHSTKWIKTLWNPERKHIFFFYTVLTYCHNKAETQLIHQDLVQTFLRQRIYQFRATKLSPFPALTLFNVPTII